jgi:cytochrome b
VVMKRVVHSVLGQHTYGYIERKRICGKYDIRVRINYWLIFANISMQVLSKLSGAGRSIPITQKEQVGYYPCGRIEIKRNC